jgi:hypothetical protein
MNDKNTSNNCWEKNTFSLFPIEVLDTGFSNLDIELLNTTGKQISELIVQK